MSKTTKKAKAKIVGHLCFISNGSMIKYGKAYLFVSENLEELQKTYETLKSKYYPGAHGHYLDITSEDSSETDKPKEFLDKLLKELGSAKIGESIVEITPSDLLKRMKKLTGVTSAHYLGSTKNDDEDEPKKEAKETKETKEVKESKKKKVVKKEESDNEESEKEDSDGEEKSEEEKPKAKPKSKPKTKKQSPAKKASPVKKVSKDSESDNDSDKESEKESESEEETKKKKKSSPKKK